MPFTREKYDGSIPGRSNGTPKRRDTFGSEGKANKHAPTKRAARDLYNLGGEQFNEENDKDRYLLTYADLITLLLGLFIILYAISTVDGKKYEKLVSVFGNTFGGSEIIETGTVITKEDDIVIEELNRVFSESGYSSLIKVEKNNEGVMIRFMDDVLFTSGSADIIQKIQPVLNNLSLVLERLPNEIRIEGHTDNIPIFSSRYSSNWELSAARALNTAKYFMETKQISSERFSIAGYSEYKPIASNNTAEGRALNRRVDIIILNKR